MYNPYQPINPMNQFQTNNNPWNTYQQPQEVLQVNGENGANSLNLPPNSSALALDTTAPVVWLIKTDSAAYRTAIPYKIEPLQQAQSTTLNDLEARIERLEGMITNDKPDSGTTGKRTSRSKSDEGE